MLTPRNEQMPISLSRPPASSRQHKSASPLMPLPGVPSVRGVEVRFGTRLDKGPPQTKRSHVLESLESQTDFRARWFFLFATCSVSDSIMLKRVEHEFSFIPVHSGLIYLTRNIKMMNCRCS